MMQINDRGMHRGMHPGMEGTHFMHSLIRYNTITLSRQGSMRMGRKD